MLAEVPAERVMRREVQVLSPRPAAVFLEAAREHCVPFSMIETDNGFELWPFPGRETRPGRCHLKVCSVRPGHTLVFFYKRSLLPFRRDRLSYGGCEWPDDQVDARRARDALDYLASGLNASARPPWLRRALTCTVPD